MRKTALGRHPMSSFPFSVSQHDATWTGDLREASVWEALSALASCVRCAVATVWLSPSGHICSAPAVDRARPARLTLGAIRGRWRDSWLLCLARFAP